MWRFRLCVPILLLVMCACAGAPAPSTPSVSNNDRLSVVYSVTGGPTDSSMFPLIVYDPQFLDRWHAFAYLEARARTQIAPLSWASDSDSIVLTAEEPFVIPVPGSPIPTAAPNSMYLQVGTTYGRSHVTVRSVYIPYALSFEALHYPSLAFGCAFRFTPAFFFDPDRFVLGSDVRNWPSADLYATEPSTQLTPLDSCYGSPLSVGATTLWHMPFGGTIITGTTLQTFATISASQWRNDGTTFDPQPGSTVVFKTAEGRVVKALVPMGPYEVTDRGDFVY